MSTFWDIKLIWELILDADHAGGTDEDDNHYKYNFHEEKSTVISASIAKIKSRKVDHADKWYTAINLYSGTGANNIQILGYYGFSYFLQFSQREAKRCEYILTVNNTYDGENKCLCPVTDKRKGINRICWFMFNGLSNDPNDVCLAPANAYDFYKSRYYAASKEDTGYYALVWPIGWSVSSLSEFTEAPYVMKNMNDDDFDETNPKCHVLYKP